MASLRWRYWRLHLNLNSASVVPVLSKAKAHIRLALQVCAARDTPAPRKTRHPNMAIFHCQIKSLSRSSGRSAIAVSAYRTGDKLIDNQDGTVYDYTRRAGVVMDQLILPGNMSANTSERNHLWNAA